MKKFLIAIGLSAAFVALPAAAAASSAQNARMGQCNADAKTKALTGAARKAFMKTCLSAKASAPAAAMPAVKASAAAVKPAVKASAAAAVKAVDKNGKPLTAQQQKMGTCNADAKAKGLKGADRKAFMKTCLSAAK